MVRTRIERRSFDSDGDRRAQSLVVWVCGIRTSTTEIPGGLLASTASISALPSPHRGRHPVPSRPQANQAFAQQPASSATTIRSVPAAGGESLGMGAQR